MFSCRLSCDTLCSENERYHNVVFSRPVTGSIPVVQSVVSVASVVAVDGGVLAREFSASLTPISVGSLSPLTPESPVSSPKSLSFYVTPTSSALTICDSIDLADAPTQVIRDTASPLSSVNCSL
jgi:hypothetical protein